MDNDEELLDFYETNKNLVVKVNYYECSDEITLENLCRLIKIINGKPGSGRTQIEWIQNEKKEYKIR